MNKIIKFTSIVLAAVLFFASCDEQDYPDRFQATDGVPTVSYVRYAAEDVFISQAFMDEILIIVGENLCSVHEIYFNDQAAILNTALMTDNTLYVSVPKTLPVEETDKIYLVTASGETVTYDFKVLPPVPTVSAMDCEYAKAGSQTVITGNYFTYPLTVEFTGADPFTVSEGSMTSFTCTVPEGSIEGRVKVTTTSGTGVSKFQYLDTRGMLFDFDGKTGLGANHGWHARVVLSDETSISGNFVQLGDGASALSNWNDSAYSFEYWAGSWDEPQNITSGEGIALYNLVDFTASSTMALKFEMMIPAETPWRDYAMQICFEGFDKVSNSGKDISGFSGTVAGPNAYAFNNDDGTSGSFGRAFYKPFEATGSFTTEGKWITVTIPITDFKYDMNYVETASTPSAYTDFASLTIFCTGKSFTGTEDADNTPIIKIDNIRAVSLN